MLFFIGIVILIVLGVYCWIGIIKSYPKGKILPTHISITIWVLDTIHALLVMVASMYSIWQLPFNKIFALVCGFAMVGIGLIIMLAGMIVFRSLRKISGLDASKMMTTGIYKWSRNPQYIGWFIWLLGISLIGRSGLAFLLTIVLIISIHLYNIWLEEPYLEHVFGEEYRLYRLKIPRYIGIPKIRKIVQPPDEG